jgi:hypothetical protein
MIRFEPDTWRDALLRPLAMASPDGGVYVEIIAPDFRFLFIVTLLLGWLVLARARNRGTSLVLPLLAITALAFVPWLATSGNGRYFIPFLLVAGPLCVGLLELIPASRSFRMALAVAMVAWQVFLVASISPWHYWGHVEWGDAPPFEVDIPREIAQEPATYVTLASISYSLIAPRFHPQSRWVNISSQAGVADKSVDGLRVQALISAPGPIRVIFPTVPGGHRGEHIDPTLARAIDELLARQALSIEDATRCRVMRSPGLAGMASRRLSDLDSKDAQVHGFWICPLARHASPGAVVAMPVALRTEQVFSKLENMCPRIFRPGEAVSLRIKVGAVRGYPGSDFKLYVLEDGRVIYKYYRALNAVELGRIDDVMAPSFKLDCDHVQGRSGLPWERGI